MNNEELLMIFVKNPVPGRVKTRLAASIGNKAALDVYHRLSVHTCTVAGACSCDKAVFYDTELNGEDLWEHIRPFKFVQEGEELGHRMMHAFEIGFKRSYRRIVIIGSDCPELSAEIINDAFHALNSHDVVIGPASDGGYYLLGMKECHEALFLNKEWSCENVLLDTLLDCGNLGLSHHLLPTLSDVDRASDLHLMGDIR